MRKVFNLVTLGGVGDALVCTPTFRRLKELYPDCKLRVFYWRPDHGDVMVNNPYIDYHVCLRPRHLLFRNPFLLLLSPFYQKLNYTNLRFQYVPLTHIYNKNVKEVVGDIFQIELPHTDIDIFLSRKEEADAIRMLAPYKNPIVLHVHSRSAVNHHWLMDRWEDVVRRLPQYTFIQLGNTDEAYVKGAIDWRGKTNLRQAFALVKHSVSFLGVDSSLSHVTNAFNIPGVVLFGDSSPVFWGHTNNINIYKKVRCSPCYYYLRWDPCPYDHECMKQISVDEVMQALVKQVEGRKQALKTGGE